MQILLVNAPFSGGYSRIGSKFPPLGIGYLLAILKKAGYEVKVVDMNTSQRKQLFSFPDLDLIGISSDTPRQPAAISMARDLKERYRVPIVLGGPHATFSPEESLRTKAIDYVVRGEGEETIVELAKYLEAGEDPQNIAGIAYLKEEGLIQTPWRKPPANLDCLPLPARELLPMGEYRSLDRKRTTSVITSRGCPFDCTFCSSSRMAGLKWRARDPQSVVEEVKLIKEKYGLRAVVFVDDNFTLDPKRTIRICDEIGPLNVEWFCETRADTISKNPDMVEAMKAAGATTVFVGFESSSEKVLKDYKKGISLEIIREAVEILKSHKIEAYGSFILGNLSETREMILNTIKLAKKLKLKWAQFSLLTPYPGTELFEIAKDKICSQDWNLYDGFHALLKPSHLSPGELRELLRKAYLHFYFRPSQLIKIRLGDFWSIWRLVQELA